MNLKKIMSISLVFAMVGSTIQPVFASSLSSETIINQEVKYGGVLIMEPQTEINTHAISPVISPLRYGESEVSSVLDERIVMRTVTPGGQLPGGERFQNMGSGFNLTIEGGTSLSFSYSLPLSWSKLPLGTIGISLKPGIARTVVSGALVTVPNTTDYFRVKIDKRTLVQYVKVDCYKYGIYERTYYTTWKKPYSNYYYCVKVNQN